MRVKTEGLGLYSDTGKITVELLQGPNSLPSPPLELAGSLGSLGLVERDGGMLWGSKWMGLPYFSMTIQ